MQMAPATMTAATTPCGSQAYYAPYMLPYAPLPHAQLQDGNAVPMAPPSAHPPPLHPASRTPAPFGLMVNFLPKLQWAQLA